MFGAAIMSLMFLGACKNEGKKDEAATVSTELAMGDMATFGVRGNCGMCKATIEKAATALEGVSKADWSVAKKQIAVTYDASKTNIEAIHQAIAAAGYDTEKATGNLGAYENLPACCKYDHSMEMNQSGDGPAEEHIIKI